MICKGLPATAFNFKHSRRNIFEPLRPLRARRLLLSEPSSRMLSKSISLPQFNCLDTYKFYLPFCVVAFVSKFYFREISRRGLIVSEIQLRLSALRICVRQRTIFNVCQVKLLQTHLEIILGNLLSYFYFTLKFKILTYRHDIEC